MGVPISFVTIVLNVLITVLKSVLVGDDIAQQRFFVLNTNSYKIKIITAVIKIFQSKPFSFGKIIIRHYLTK